MSDDALLLQRKFSELIRWERTKRRETVLLAAFCYALLVSLLLLPARGVLPAWFSPFYFPLVSFLLLAPACFWLRPWGEKDSLRALLVLDRALRLHERAITAAEILQRHDPSAVEQHVLSEAGEKLRSVDVKALFKRRCSWHALLAPPLLLVWLGLVWLDFGMDFGAPASRTASLAQKLKEFSQELRQKAEAQDLAETLKVARALQELAEERLRGQGNDKKLGENLAALEKRLEERAPGGESDSALGAYGREALSSLKAELEAIKGQLRPGSTIKEKELLDRLSSLPLLSRALEQGRSPMGGLAGQELQSFLDQLERSVAAELDRRSLAEVEDFLSLLLRGREAGDARSEATIDGGRAGEKRSADNAGGKGVLAGDQPGTRTQRAQPPPGGASAATELKGILREGKSSGLTWRAETKPGESKIPEQEVAASYRRQLEEDLASEKIPHGVKETVKKYFLSLGMGEEKQ
jgi:hypothetical protein